MIFFHSPETPSNYCHTPFIQLASVTKLSVAQREVLYIATLNCTRMGASIMK